MRDAGYVSLATFNEERTRALRLQDAIDRLEAELAASQAEVEAHQERYTRLVEQSLRDVAEAREETREACWRVVDRWFASHPPPNSSPADLVRATPIGLTPLRDELEALKRGMASRTNACTEEVRAAESERDALKAENNSLRVTCAELERETVAEEVHRLLAERDALKARLEAEKDAHVVTTARLRDQMRATEAAEARAKELETENAEFLQERADALKGMFSAKTELFAARKEAAALREALTPPASRVLCHRSHTDGCNWREVQKGNPCSCVLKTEWGLRLALAAVPAPDAEPKPWTPGTPYHDASECECCGVVMAVAERVRAEAERYYTAKAQGAEWQEPFDLVALLSEGRSK